MKSLFKPQDNKEIIERFNKLSPKSQSKWGKMNVSQMFSHCRMALNVAFGDVKLKKNIIGILFGAVARKMIIHSNKPMKRNLPTDKSFIFVDEREFEKEKFSLISLIEKFENEGPEAVSNESHPIFGKLSYQEWDALTWKHLDHHLRQFGA